MQSRQFSHWLLVLVQGLRVLWALLLQQLQGCGGITIGICHCEGRDQTRLFRLVVASLAAVRLRKSKLLER